MIGIKDIRCPVFIDGDRQAIHTKTNIHHVRHLPCQDFTAVPINNRHQIEDVLPCVNKKCRLFVAECRQHGIDILITSAYRDNESQNAI